MDSGIYNNERMEAAIKQITTLMETQNGKELSSELSAKAKKLANLDDSIDNLLNAGKLSGQVAIFDDKIIEALVKKLKEKKNSAKEFNAIFLEIMTIIGGLAKIIK